MAASTSQGINARLGLRVEVIGKGLIGTISYVGMTGFAAGKWIGVALDDPKGKNDGTVQGKKYFECPSNHGIFVRQTQLTEFKEEQKVESTIPLSSNSGIASPRSGIASPRSGIASPSSGGLKRPGFSSSKMAMPQVKSAETSPRPSGIKAPSPVPGSVSKNAPQERALSPASGLRKPGGSISPPGSVSAIAKPKSGLAKPNQGLTKPAGTASEDSKQPTGLQKPQSGLQKMSEASSSPALKKPQIGGLRGPMGPSGLAKSGQGSGLQAPKVGLQKSPAKQEMPTSSEPLSNIDPVEVTPPKEEIKSAQDAVKPAEQLPPAHKVIAASEEVSDLQRKLMEKEKAVVDLEEKLNVIKQKRQTDVVKLKEVEKLRIQNQQFVEYKAKWQESQRELQNQLRQAQNEAREAVDKISSEDEVSELQEAVEMATLDKEMAEEKFESLAIEHEQLKERNEEVSLELEILKNEISEGGVESVAASAQSKQLEQQNHRLKEALVKLKDIAQNDKMELAQVQRTNKEFSQNLSSLGSERDKLQERLHEAESQVDELKEQVDMSLGAEEMVEKLTDKNLELEEKIETYEETIQDLEALRELNEELEESHVQTEHDLREELDMADNKIRELERQITAQIGQATDYQETISKFRLLVQNLQGRIKDLHDQSTDSIDTEDFDTTPVPEVDFKTKIAETKQFGRIIELELNKYYVFEANKKIDMINSFLPDHFTKRGADYDGICLLLLLERLKFKCKLLSDQLHEKHNIQDIVEAGQPIDGVKGDQASYACLLAYQLSNFYVAVSQYLRALNVCDVATFVRVSGQFPELAVHEKILDNYIELLRQDQLDDTVSLEVLEKTINQYKNFYKLQLSTAPRDCTEFLADTLVMFNNGAEAVSIDGQRLKGMAQNCDEGSVFLNLMSFLELKNMEIKQLCRKIKRRMIQDSNTTLSYPESVTAELLDALQEQSMIVRYSQDLASVLSLKYAQLPEGELLLSGHLEESSQDCITLVYEKDGEAMDVLSESYKKILSCLSGIAIKLPEGEYDTEPEEKPQPAYLERATTFKDELSSTTKLEAKIDQKSHELNELKKAMKNKADELSEANIRIGMLDKRADNAAKEAGVKVEQITKKHEALQLEYRDKTKQNEKTMDALQSDIDALENENTDLKKKLEIYSKKSNLDLARLSQTSAAMAGIVSPGKPGSAMASLAKAGVAGASPVQVVLKDSPIFLAQLESQKRALQYLQTENWALKCSKMKEDLDQLPKPYMPRRIWKDGNFVPNPELKTESEKNKLTPQGLAKECRTLYQNLTKLAVFPKVVDITKGKTADGKFKPSPEEQFSQQLNVLMKLDRQKDELVRKVETVVSQQLPGASVKSDLRSFISPEYSRLRQENEAPVHIATLKVPKSHPDAKSGVRNVSLTPQEFARIHEVLAKS